LNYFVHTYARWISGFRLIKICLHETYSKVLRGSYTELSEIRRCFIIKNIRKVHVDDVNKLCENINTIKKNTGALLEFGLEVNTEKPKCMVVSRYKKKGKITIF
jgi:hypothetical protein